MKYQAAELTSSAALLLGCGRDDLAGKTQDQKGRCAQKAEQNPQQQHADEDGGYLALAGCGCGDAEGLDEAVGDPAEDVHGSSLIPRLGSALDRRGGVLGVPAAPQREDSADGGRNQQGSQIR